MSALPDHAVISKRELRAKAMTFAKAFTGATSEASDKQSFWNAFFEIFGVSARSVGAYEVMAKRLSTGGRGYIDFLYPGELAVEHKSAGEDLDKAMDQLIDYLDSLQDAAMPRLLVACDFQNFYWKDLASRTEGTFKLEDLSEHIEMFWWLAGYRATEAHQDEEAANLDATEFMARLHDAVWASKYPAHALREWLTRILFCLFADDTEVWDRSAFTNYIFLNTREDGSDLGQALAYLFQLLNTPESERPDTLDEDLKSFTYINGDMFSEALPIPTCDSNIRNALLAACKFNWSAISPAIFGSMFQNVMTPAERRELGAHYTTEENILKTIRPLFLDQLEEDLARSNSKSALDRFHDRIANLAFMDPACGCGNFLVIAYRELRRLESELWAKRLVATKQTGMAVIDVSQVCRVTVSQFFGIEIEEFPARIARTALYLMDHKANLEFSKTFGQYFVRFPIPASPHIRVANALRMDWNDLLPARQVSYVLGNPPFVGALRLDADQTEDRDNVFGGMTEASGLRPGRLDYVLCWYAKAFQYLKGTRAAAAFVSTNSITQGEQARSIGPLMDRCGFEIDFAYRTFAWTSEAKGKAIVHCVIVGFSCVGAKKAKFIFDSNAAKITTERRSVSQINAWLIDAPSVVLEKRSTPLVSGPPLFTVGSQPTDGGGLLLDEPDMMRAMADPIAKRFVRQFLGAEEMLHGKKRWCLWLVDASPIELTSLNRPGFPGDKTSWMSQATLA